MAENTQTPNPEKYSPEYYAQMPGGRETAATPEDSTTNIVAGETALAGAQVSIENDNVAPTRQPVVVERPAPTIITDPGISAYRHAGLTEGGSRFGIDPDQNQ